MGIKNIAKAIQQIQLMPFILPFMLGCKFEEDEKQIPRSHSKTKIRKSERLSGLLETGTVLW